MEGLHNRLLCLNKTVFMNSIANAVKNKSLVTGSHLSMLIHEHIPAVLVLKLLNFNT